MNNRDLDELLRSYADKPVPTLPSNLEDAVWREIRLRRETPVHESFLDWLAACVWREHSAAAFRGRRYGIRRWLRVVRSGCKHGAAHFPCAELAGLFRATADVALDQSLPAAVKVWVRLLLFVLLLGAVAAVTFYVCNHFLHQSVAGPVNYHYWIHRELGLSAKQESDLEPIEAKFAGRRDELVASIREANRELAEALLADKSDSERVKDAVQKIHQCAGRVATSRA